MGKLDKVLEVATPVAKEAAKETVKITGKGLKLAGKGMKKASEKAVEIKRDNRIERTQEQVQPILERYPGCRVFLAYNANHFNYHKLNKMGLDIKLLDLDHTMHYVFDQYETVRYKIDEYYDSFFRHSDVSDYSGVIGIAKAHKKVFSGEQMTIHYQGERVFSADNRYKNDYDLAEFSIETSGTGYKVFLYGELEMEVLEERGHDIIIVVHPEFTENSILLYAALCLRMHRPPSRFEGGG